MNFINKKLKINDNSIKENIIGILLLMPIYMVELSILILFKLYNIMLIPILIYLPIIGGMILSYNLYKDKINKLIGAFILIFMALANLFFYNTYLNENTDFNNGIAYMGLWLINAVACRFTIMVFYSKIVGWKKALTFFIASIIFFLLMYNLLLFNSLMSNLIYIEIVSILTVALILLIIRQ